MADMGQLDTYWSFWLCAAVGGYEHNLENSYAGDVSRFLLSDREYLRHVLQQISQQNPAHRRLETMTLKDFFRGKDLERLRGSVMGMAIVRIQGCYADSLQTLTAEQGVALRMRGARLGTVFLEVVRFIDLPNPEKAVHMGGAERPSTEVFSLTRACVQRMMNQSVREVAEGEPLTMRDEILDSLYRVLGGPPPEDYPTQSALQVPIGLLHLLSAKQWNTLAISPASKWDEDSDVHDLISNIRTFASAVPSRGEVVTFHMEPSEQQGVVEQVVLYEKLSSDLCRWSDAICAAEEDPDETRNLIQSYVVFLNSVHEAHSRDATERHNWDTSLVRKAGGSFNKELQAFCQYRASFLLQCVLFSLKLKSSSLLCKAMKLAMRCLPPYWSAVLESVISSKVMPSAATLCRARLFLDVSFMLMMQSWFESQVEAGSVFYLLADSSPQGQQNWLMIETFGVRGPCLARCSCLLEKLYMMRSQDGPVPIDSLEASLDWVRELQDASFHHVFPPSALGVKHATLAHKAHALCHSLRLETSSWRDTQNLLDNTVTLTSDQGVESGLNQVLLPLAQAFPYWHTSTIFEADSGAVEDSDALQLQPEEATLEFISLRGSLYAPGFFHILDGATHDLLQQSLMWPDHKAGFENLLKFFHRKYCRDMFSVSCLDVRPEMRPWSSHFKTGPPLFAGGRAWGVVQEGVRWLLEREGVIRDVWDMEPLSRFGANNPNPRGDQDAGSRQEHEDSGAMITKASEAVGSKTFWSFMHLLQSLTHVLDALMQWAQSCPCHPEHIHAQLKPLLGSERLKCPMKGLRGPELCDGSFFDLLDTLLTFNRTELVVRHCASLAAEEKTRMLADWSKLGGFLKTVFQLKLSVWTSLPLLIVGLGHASLSQARRLMWKALAEYESITQGGQPEQHQSLHPLTQKLFSASGDLRKELELFLRGESFQSGRLPSLERLRWQMHYVPILEQSIERRHAVLHQRIKVAPNHSGQFVSLVERAHEVEALVSHPDQMTKMAEHCMSVRSPALVCQGLGLSTHPAVAQWLQSSKLQSQTPHTVVASLVYRCDLQTQFMAGLYVHLPAAPKPNPKPTGLQMLPQDSESKLDALEDPAAGSDDDDDDDDDDARAGADKDAVAGLGLAGAGPGDDANAEVLAVDMLWQNMLCTSAWDHVCKKSTAEVFYSIVPEMCQAPLTTLREMLEVPKAFPESIACALLDAGVADHAICDIPQEALDAHGQASALESMQFESDAGVVSEMCEELVPFQQQQQQQQQMQDESFPVEQQEQEQYSQIFSKKSDLLFFRLLLPHVKKRKRANVDAAPAFQAGQAVIQHHRLREVLLAKKSAAVYLDAAGDAPGCAADVLSQPGALKSFFRWRLSEIKTCVKDRKLTPVAEEALDVLCQKETLHLPEDSDDMRLETLRLVEGLTALCDMGIVSKNSRPDLNMKEYTLAGHALPRLCQVAVLCDPVHVATPASRDSSGALVFENMSRMELMLYLA